MVTIDPVFIPFVFFFNISLIPIMSLYNIFSVVKYFKLNVGTKITA